MLRASRKPKAYCLQKFHGLSDRQMRGLYEDCSWPGGFRRCLQMLRPAPNVRLREAWATGCLVMPLRSAWDISECKVLALAPMVPCLHDICKLARVQMTQPDTDSLPAGFGTQNLSSQTSHHITVATLHCNSITPYA